MPPTGRLTVSLMLPEPDAVQVPPPAPTQVQVAPVSAAGKVSATVAPVAALGPGVRGDDRVGHRAARRSPSSTPSVLVIARSACGVSVSVSVADVVARRRIGDAAGRVTVAVLDERAGRRRRRSSQSRCRSTVPPTGRLTRVVDVAGARCRCRCRRRRRRRSRCAGQRRREGVGDGRAGDRRSGRRSRRRSCRSPSCRASRSSRRRSW